MEIAAQVNSNLPRSYIASFHQPLGGGNIGRYSGGARPSQAANMSSHVSNQSPLVHSQGHTSSNYSIQSQPSSRSSDTTQGTAHSTLFPPPPVPSGGLMGMAGGPLPNGNDVTATDNIMNTVADASSSLFQICVTLRQRLMGVPGFEQSLVAEEDAADEDTDPVTLLWRTFCQGFPLMLLYNTLRPSQPLTIGSGVKEDKRSKAATFKFLQACVNDLKFPAEECFIVTDLYGEDTGGFVKVARVVNRVLDILVQRGLIDDVRPTASDFEQAARGMKRSQRQHIVHELVTTERTYVQHLELLQAFKLLVEERGIVPGDAVHDIFLNLNALLNFQRRFLIRVEQTNAMREEEQNWGKIFDMYCDGFMVYEPYIANQRKCEKTVVAEFAKLKEAGGNLEMRQMVESPTSLYGFLMKPFQRLSKYPLLLDDLYKKGDLDDARKADLLIGREAATSVLSRTNKAVDREEKAEAVQELKMRVEDWKGHRVEGFGELLLYGTYTVLKSENLSSGKDGERQYHVYLFETILLCCKDIDPSKAKNKLTNKQLVDKRGKPKLQLKGRIFMQNVTDLVSLAKPGSYTCQIFWKGDPSIENFIIRFMSEEAMRKWAQQIDAQRRRYKERSRASNESRGGGTSVTEFTYMQNQPALVNPYTHAVDDEEDDAETLVANGVHSWQGYPGKVGSDFSQSRNGSASSLRSRSTTGDSGTSTISGRAVPSRLGHGSVQQQAPLTLRTREVQQMSQSPADFAGESYFSPTSESPHNSTRTSSGSGVFPFPRQAVPQNGYYDEGYSHTRFTAPVMGRPPLAHREHTAPSNGYAPPGRSARPGFAAAGGMHSAQQLPTAPRHRSASSPDIQNGPRLHLRTTGQPPVPDMPAPYQQSSHMISRSQSNSPNMPNGTPPRGPTSSPQAQRERALQSRPQMLEPSPITYGIEAPLSARPDLRPTQHPSSRAATPVTARPANTLSPPPQIPTPVQIQTMADIATPTQLKVKVHCPSASQVLTLVVPLNISYQSLKDRIDAKLQRSTNLSLGDRGPKESQVKLKYLDEDDFVSIQSDEDVLTAFETWREQRGVGIGGMGEIELYCQR